MNEELAYRHSIDKLDDFLSSKGFNKLQVDEATANLAKYKSSFLLGGGTSNISPYCLFSQIILNENTQKVLFLPSAILYLQIILLIVYSSESYLGKSEFNWDMIIILLFEFAICWAVVRNNISKILRSS